MTTDGNSLALVKVVGAGKAAALRRRVGPLPFRTSFAVSESAAITAFARIHSQEREFDRKVTSRRAEVTFKAQARYKGCMNGGSAWNDEALMLAYAGGDGGAFDELFRRYGTRLFNFLLRASGDRAMAEDLFQATFLRLHQARKNYVAGTFKAFLFTIAANLLRDEWSRAEHKRRVSMDEEAIEAIPAGNRFADSDPESLSEARETSETIEAAIAQLPQGLREALLLSRYQGLSGREIASVLGISEGAVKVRLFRALAQLRAALRAPDKAAGESGNE